MRIARLQHGEGERWGFVEHDHVAMAPLDGPSLVDTLGLDAEERSAVRGACAETAALSDVSFLAPVPCPPQFLGVGLNYADHAAEAGMEPPPHPQVFGLLSSAIVGPDEPVRMPATSEQLDWEVELAFVIGRPGRHIELGDALSHVAGYTIVNDLSARDIQFGDGQWTRGKSFDTLKPMGPWITTADELGAAADLDVELTVNDVVKQSSNTSQLIFDVAQLIHFLSREITLETGSVVSTGTPGGVGFSRQPPEFLRAGDAVELTIEGIGTLKNTVIEAD